jgi:hypothetical protein
MWLLPVAAFGLLVPNGLFIYWLVNDFSSLNQVLSDKLAVAFMLDLAVATALLAYLVAAKPLGPIRWPWFLFLSLLGGLAFSIPLYLWLNWRAASRQKVPFSTWWRAV